MKRRGRMWVAVAAVLLPLLPIAPASGETRSATETAPYEWGQLCYKLVWPFSYDSNCIDDFTPAKSGIIGALSVTKAITLPADPTTYYLPRAWRGAAGIYFQSDVPGTLAMKAEVAGLARGSQINGSGAWVCLVLSSGAETASPMEKAGGTEACNQEDSVLTLENEVHLTSSEKHLIQVGALTQYGVFSAAVVRSISYVFTPDVESTDP